MTIKKRRTKVEILQEKLDKYKIVSGQMLSYLRSISNTLKNEAEEYDCKWPVGIAKEISNMKEYFEKELK